MGNNTSKGSRSDDPGVKELDPAPKQNINNAEKAVAKEVEEKICDNQSQLTPLNNAESYETNEEINIEKRKSILDEDSKSSGTDSKDSLEDLTVKIRRPDHGEYL